MKFLITGGNGLLGSKLAAAAKSVHEVIPTDITKPLPLNSIKMNITDKKEISQVFDEFKPDVVVHTAAETDVDRCEIEKERAWEVNVDGTKNIADACSGTNAKLIYISTDYVFDGEKGLYNEEDEPRPINHYGLTKLKAEEHVATVDESLILRTSVLYGWHPWKKNFATWIIDSIKQNKSIEVVEDHYNSPTLADNLAEAILEAVNKDLAGLFHASGSERVSRFNFARRIAETFGLDENLVKPIKTDELKAWVAKRPRDSSLRVDKIQGALETKLLGLSESFELMKERTSLF